MKIAVDFDGTIVEHKYPYIGRKVPNAITWLRQWQFHGAQIILFTMRAGVELDAAVEYLEANGIKLWGINTDPDQTGWTASPKAYAELYIDDAAFGCPLKESSEMGARPFVDWSIVGPSVLERIKNEKEKV